VNLIVIDSGDSNRFSKLKRVFRALKFSIVSCYYGLTEPADVILSSSGPITVALPGLLRKKVRKTPFVFEVRDLWPLGAIVMGKIKNKWVQRVLLKFESVIYTRADKIVTCSPGQAENIKIRLGHAGKLHVISNASDEELFGVYESLTSDQKDIVGNQPYVLHLGSLGFIHNVSYLIEAAQYVPQIPFVLIGDGAERKMLEQKVSQLGISNVIFLGQMPKKDTVAWISNCELSLFTTLDNEIQDTSSPNKIFDSFAAGKPIVQTTRGWIKEMVESLNCGLNADPQNPKDFAEKIREYFNLEECEKEKKTESVKNIAKLNFNRDHLAKKYLILISQINKNDN
jgi:glycosyltransferase involved in cell wall biosynthesis